MKKYISLLIAAVLTLSLFTACGSKETTTETTDAGSTETTEESEDKLQVVTTIFPEYDWVMNVLGDKASDAEVTMLLGSGVDLHSYEPTPEDILKITTCDVFVYVGGESDKWVADALAEATNKDMQVINLMETLGDSVSEEEIVEGMEAEEEEEEGEEGEEEVEYDEHVWLSLKNAATLVDSIEMALSTADEANAETYSANAAAYKEELLALDEEYASAVANKSVDAVLFGDRFPFRYMVDDYDLDYYAAFVGCSAETEASFETITFLAQKVDELSLPVVLDIDGSDGKIAQTIVDNTSSKDQQILTMNSMQSTTYDDVDNGVTYLSVMEENLGVLKQALGVTDETVSADATDAQKKTTN
ncbi:MAG: metal ABC transporter substrate-binding protein [Lachnospiraceae bacterium]|nr:metal ABC transporter substrate-binding protein [Lachnospiraceae bacterium]